MAKNYAGAVHTLEPAAVTDLFEDYYSLGSDGLGTYAAGYPSYPANFSRDTIVAGILSSHAGLLSSQLETSAHYQGMASNPHTGEEIGKIHHEMPGAQLPDRVGETTYNACDSTALFLIGVEALLHCDPERAETFQTEKAIHLEHAAEHILSSVGEDNLFRDSPPIGGSGFALRVTYWKDSILPHADGKLEPKYPIVYGHAHFVAARGLLSAAHILGKPELEVKADLMFKAGINEFIAEDHYTIYRDAEGILRQISSDELHALAYIPLKYGDLLPLSAIKQRAKELATPFGYMCTPSKVAQHLSDGYHGDKIWVFEQAKIHYGASKFGLTEEAATAQAINDHIGLGQELFEIQDGVLKPKGNNRQLWSVAAAEYFAGKSILSTNSWL